MPTERLLMRQIREILRLRWACGLPQRAVARACGAGLGTVSEYCRRAAQAGLSWPLPDDLDDRQLEARLFQRVHDLVGIARPLPDMAWLHQELKRPGVTLQRLWLEYLDAHPDHEKLHQRLEETCRIAATEPLPEERRRRPRNDDPYCF